MYSIILTNGNIVHVKADMVEWSEITKIVRFVYNERTVARINANSMVGWIDADYEVEGEE